MNILSKGSYIVDLDGVESIGIFVDFDRIFIHCVVNINGMSLQKFLIQKDIITSALWPSIGIFIYDMIKYHYIHMFIYLIIILIASNVHSLIIFLLSQEEAFSKLGLSQMNATFHQASLIICAPLLSLAQRCSVKCYIRLIEALGTTVSQS